MFHTSVTYSVRSFYGVVNNRGVVPVHTPDVPCMFCNEHETAKHLFFECVVAKCIWDTVSSILNKPIGDDFESIARWWISEDKKVCY
jgi:hypothetical protein